MVFNSYGPEDNSAATGARVYYFFPRTRLPDILVQGDFVTVQTATPGVDFTFSRTTGLMTNFSAGNFIEEPVAPTNSGGIQLQLSRGLMLDVGYARGYDPSTKPTASSVFYDGFMHKCSVKNSMLFKYLPDGDIVFNMSDLDLDVFLKRQCPQLVYTL